MLKTLVILLVVVAVRCQESESRRAVTEHQLMHDRGRSIQSLKRLIWLSGAIEGLHTAQSRALKGPERILSLPDGQKRALETVLSELYRPHPSTEE